MMSQNKQPLEKKPFSVDWLVRGTLTRIGDIFDRFTGRSWKPTSSLATSELIERLKKLLDAEVKDLGRKGRFVPHHLKLKIQWDKFSSDSEDAMKKLENELLTAVIDHINDNRYHTYAPLKFEIKPDYFVEGVKLQASFDKFAEEETDVEMNVTVPNLKNIVIPQLEEPKIEEAKEIYIAEFSAGGKPKKVELAFSAGQRLSVGRTRENALSIEDTSVSKIHAAFVLNSEKQLMIADTGSTNGTFINGKRIAYGKAFPVSLGDKLKFGTVDVALEYVAPEVEEEVLAEDAPLPNSAVATEQMITESDYLKTQNAPLTSENILDRTLNVSHQTSSQKTLVDEKQSLLPENSSLPKVTAEQQPISSAANIKAEEKADLPKDSVVEILPEDAAPPTEQRIVLDFGENK